MFACLLLTASLAVAQESEKSPIKIGGAIGINYAYGTYEDNDRGENGGGIDVDVFRLNADLAAENVLGRLEYRWQAGGGGSYDTYSMIHIAIIVTRNSSSSSSLHTAPKMTSASSCTTPRITNAAS